MNIFDAILVDPILNILLFIYHILFIFNTPYALGFSIIVLTVIIRFVLYPLTTAQLKATKKMQDLNPHISRIKDKHKGDAKTIQAETMKLYKEFGVNPAAGCLPVLIQLPVIWGLYAVLIKVINLGANTVAEVNKLAYSDFLKISKPWDVYFLGIPLAQNPGQLFNSSEASSWLILLIPLLTGVFQFIQSKMMMTSAPKKDDAKLVKGDKKKDDFATAFQSQSLYIFPIMIGFLSYTFPIGLSLYWNTFTIFGIMQQYKVSGLGGLLEWKEKIWQRK